MLIFLNQVSDAYPRIRSGVNLDKLDSLSTHDLNKELISCEALQSKSKSGLFDEVQWFTSDYQKLNTISQSISLTESYNNLTAEFVLINGFVNELFKCCTILKGSIMDCQSTRLIK
jgi:hypothetical protein